jgi:hypothetical protein
VFEPLEFLERLAALVPPPRAHLVLYHGILAPHANWRAAVIPTRDAPAPSENEALPENEEHGSRARRLSWAAPLKRVFGIDVLVCDRCGGPRKVVAFVTDPIELARICESHGVPSKPPRPAPARSPPQGELAFLDAC